MVFLSLVSTRAPAAISTGTDEEAQLPYWEVAEAGVSVRLVQRLPDQTRGFFQARGFSVADADRIAMSCVFQTIFRNASPAPDRRVVHYDLDDWVVHAGGERRAMKTREHWKAEWTARQAPVAAQLAFEWSLLPTRQSYAPGDFNWGMSVFNLAPGAVFDLDVVWRYGTARHVARIRGMRCAPDIHPEPAAQ